MIIGISGKKRSGKDTFFNIASKLLKRKYLVKRYAFADNVKKFAIRYLKIPPEEIKNEKNRYILQGLGQLFREEISQDFWINSLFEDINKSRELHPTEISVITDVRYINEVQRILNNYDSILVKIENSNTQEIDYHPSEIELDNFDFDFIIKNEGTLQNYEEQIELWLKQNLPWIIHW